MKGHPRKKYAGIEPLGCQKNHEMGLLRKIFMGGHPMKEYSRGTDEKKNMGEGLAKKFYLQ